MMFYLLPYLEQGNLYKFCQNANGTGYDVEQGAGPASTSGTPNQTPKVYVCPSDPTQNPSAWRQNGSYAFNGMIFQADWVSYSNFPASIPDGASNTIFFTDTYSGGTYANGNIQTSLWWWDYNSFETPASSNGDCGGLFYGQAFTPLVSPTVQYCNSNTVTNGWGGVFSACSCRASAGHTSVVNVGMGDGSCRSVSQGVSQATWFAACTPSGGETLGSDW
jgi:hypothetical protein